MLVLANKNNYWNNKIINFVKTIPIKQTDYN